MAQSLIEKLDAAYARDTNPDAIARLLGDPLRTFIKVKDITEAMFEELKDREIAYYRYGGVDSPCWNGRQSAEDVRISWLHQRDYPELRGDSWLCAHWAIIGHEYRLDPDLVFPS